MDPIVIVGGGIVGTSLAYQLQDDPRDVILLEKDRLAAGSTGDSRSIFAWHLNTDGVYYDICETSWEIFQPMIESGLVNFHEGGFLMLAQTDAYLTDLEGRVEEYRDAGIETRVLDSADLAEYRLDPSGGIPGGLYLEEGRFTGVAGAEICTYFADRAAASGVEIRERTQVTDVRTADGEVTGVETPAGEIDASAVVNAAGPWSPMINEMAGVNLPLKHTLAPMIEYELEEEFGPNEPLSLLTYEDGLYFVGEFPRLAWAGNAPHEGGGHDLFDTADTMNADTEFNAPLTNEFRQSVADRIDALHPPLRTATVNQEWKCMRIITPDHYPLAGETELEGYHVATGMSGQGITVGPGVTKYLAEYIMNDEQSPELEALHPHRFD